ncbi:TRAP transporter permease [Pseudomonas aeruginosa]|uniref:TRAP transporter permease n=1 Tax=Pseudomonas aeruginosa TaxID=287 RepID=UPI001B3852CF|nr:TRAP transporter large permease subunit [Pseudomonas aeruginosa]MBP8450463.1 TRAP transporter permease [Pseudomonas aeruginosa]MBP8464094.1 TRAP transporter permease [Pseudomonas aeruginosa]
MSDHQNGLHLEAENWPRALFAVALAFSVFQVVTAAFPLISTQVLRAMHVGLLLLVVYISYPAFGIGRPWQPLAWLLGMAGLGTAVYQWVFEGDLIQRSGELTQADMVVGVVLIALLFSGRTPLFSGTIGLALTAIVILGSAIILRVSSLGLRIAFWVALGLLCAGFFRLGIGVIFVVIAALALACWFVRGGRETLRICVRALAEGARHAIPVGIACTLVGVIIGVISLTGIATTFASYVLDLGRENLLLSLVLTMVTCLVLGMGIPTIPNYIITSSIAAPALLELGVPLIVSHMFVFYFGILADLTPPVALACFAAAPIAKERGLKISFWAVRIALAGFVVPFMAVYSPALMLQEGGWGATLYVTCKAVLAIGLWGMASIGYLQGPLAWWERLVAFAAGASLVLALPISDELGFVLGALVIGWHLWRQRAREAVA